MEVPVESVSAAPRPMMSMVRSATEVLLPSAIHVQQQPPYSNPNEPPMFAQGTRCPLQVLPLQSFTNMQPAATISSMCISTSTPPATAVPSMPNSCAAPVQLPKWLVASPMGRSDGLDLSKAFWAFNQANELQKQLKSQPSGEALYSKACCLSLAVEEQVHCCVRGSGSRDLGIAVLDSLPLFVASASMLVAPDLPPQMPPGASLRSSLEWRLDLSLELLRQAAAAGYDVSREMPLDPNLRAARQLRPTQFTDLLQQTLHSARGTPRCATGPADMAGTCIATMPAVA